MLIKDSNRKRLAIALLVIFAIFTNIRFFRHSLDKQYSDKFFEDEISLFEKELIPLKDALSGTNVVGYITDKRSERVLVEFDSIKKFCMMQYVISPTILINSVDSNLVIGDFKNPDNIKSQPFLRRRFLIVKDYGNGLMLFKRARR